MTAKKSQSASVMVKLGSGEWTPGTDAHLEAARKHAAAKKVSIDARPLTETEKALKLKPVSPKGV